MMTDLIAQPDGSERALHCYWREAIEGGAVRCRNPIFRTYYPDGHDWTSCRWCEPSGHDDGDER